MQIKPKHTIYFYQIATSSYFFTNSILLYHTLGKPLSIPSTLAKGEGGGKGEILVTPTLTLGLYPC